MRILKIFSLIMLASFYPTQTHAQDINTPSLLALSIGYYDILDEPDGVDFRVEYRPSNAIFIQNLKPWAGIELTAQGSIWGGGGILYDWQFKDQWRLTPSLGLGLYSDGGSDIDLDSPVQFRTQLEASYEFEGHTRLGLALSHMSNAGLGDSNPGTETISLYWSIPFNKLSRLTSR